MGGRQGKVSGDWESGLSKRHDCCVGCAAPFGEGDSFYGVIRFDDDGITRRDLCPECFEGERSDAFAYWKTRRSASEDNRPRPLDLAFLADFFRRLEQGSEEDRHQDVAYIVALLLLRKKILEQIRTERAGDEERLVVRFRKDGDKEYTVTVPDLTPERMEAIRDDLGRIFNLDDKQPKEGTAAP